MCGLLAAGWFGTANAGEHFYDFNPPNGNPATSGFILFGTNTNGWQTNGGFTGTAGDGFLEITPSAPNTDLGILFPLDYFTNADNSLTALPLLGFELDVDVRIGNTTLNNGRPADGFSISFASSQDPVVYWGSQGQFRGWAGGDSNGQAVEPPSFNFATGTGFMDPTACDSGDAENGTKTGVSVQFDTWQGNVILDQNGNAAPDNVGWRVHYNGKMIERIQAQPPSGPLPTSKTPDPTGADLNGLAVCPAPLAPTDFTQPTSCEAVVAADTNSIQTGPYYTDQDDGTTHSGSYTNLAWSHLSVVLTTNTPHLLTVTYKGRKLVNAVAITNFAPYVGQIIMGGRNGNADENRDIDNVHIVTYPAVISVFGGITSSSVFLNDFSLLLQNVGPAKVTKINSITLDGVDISKSPNTTITIADPNSTIKYSSATSFPSGSSHTVDVTWTDALGNVQTQNSGFSVVNYTVMPASASVPAASVDTTQTGVGFLIAAHQTTQSEPNNAYWADEQLMGLHGTNHIDFSIFATTNNEVEFSDMIDFSNGSGSNGQFPVNNSFSSVGIPAADLPNDNNIALGIAAYLYFPTPGVYVFGGNSDDGFRLTFAKNSHDLLGTKVPGMMGGEGGRGIASLQNIGAVVITNAGYYGFRMLYFNGGGGAGLEWYTTQTPGGVTNVLVNDVNNNTPSQVVAAFNYSTAAPAYVSYAEPPLDDINTEPTTVLTYKLTDAATTVNAGTVSLKVNGVAQSPTVNNASGVTTISQPPPAARWSIGTNTVELSFKDTNGTNYDYSYPFVVQPYATLDPTQSVPIGKQDTTKPGFVLTVDQIDFAQVNDVGDSMPNQTDSRIAAMAGLWYPWYGHNAANVANTFGTNVAATSSNEWDWTSTVLFNANGPANSIGDYAASNYFLVPGIPGVLLTNNLGGGAPYNNYSTMFKTWVAFPQAGFYQMDVNSDDGFRLFEGLGPTRQVLHVTGTGINTDVGAVVADTSYGNSSFGVPPPIVPISAPVLFVNSNNYNPASGINLTGKIAVVDENFYGLGNDALLCYIAQTNGALGVITINPPSNGFPGVMGGTPPAPVTIPSLMVNGFGGQRDFWVTNQNLTASIGASQGIILGSADYGKGRSEIVFGFYVPQAGVYPLTLVYFQGGGGAGCEWTSITPDGNRHLVNDTTDASSFLAYRAATVVAPPMVSVGHNGSSIVITYTGTLQSSSTVNGTYSNVTGAVSPYTVPVSGSPGALFYRSH